MGARITVVGAGFAGLTALRTLRRHAPDASLTLVAPRAELHYLPGTIWIPSGLRSRADLVVPLDEFLRRERISFHRAHATGLSADGRILHTEAGDVGNDGLVKMRDESVLTNYTLQKTAGKLIDQENPDRMSLIYAVAEAHGGKEAIPVVRELTVKRWKEQWKSGWWMEDEQGRWIKKP